MGNLRANLPKTSKITQTIRYLQMLLQTILQTVSFDPLAVDSGVVRTRVWSSMLSVNKGQKGQNESKFCQTTRVSSPLSLFALRRRRQELYLQHLTELQNSKNCSCCIPKIIELYTQKQSSALKDFSEVKKHSWNGEGTTQRRDKNFRARKTNETAYETPICLMCKLFELL